MATQKPTLSVAASDLGDIQGLARSGYRHHRSVAFLPLRVLDVGAARRWIGELARQIPSAVDQAREPGEAPVLHLAISYQGLIALDLDETMRQEFPFDFEEGMDTPHRSLILGDRDASAPQHWRFGQDGKEHTAHLLLLVYLREEQGERAFRAPRPRFEKQLAEIEATLASHGVERVVDAIRSHALPGDKEHFGFRDGIGQPRFRFEGVHSKRAALPAGELLLGYLDGYKEVAHAPRTRSGFAFGLRGTFLVMRQMSQDVGAFWRFIARQCESGSTKLDPIALASKMVGRWPSGAPLALFPDADPGEKTDRDDDAFLYRARDPEGFACPPGAHIRRSNPRDWGLAEGAKDNLAIVDRHRLLRRGRAYGPPYTETLEVARMIERAKAAGPDDASEERGLIFVSLQASIDRQFEFVQQHWLNNPKFAGLVSGPDPTSGVHPGDETGVEPATFTIPARPVRERIVGIQRFATVRGGGYFFLPSLSALRWIGEQR